jgi:hypothetical protein
MMDVLAMYDKVRHRVLTQNVACAAEIILLACRDILAPAHGERYA